ncbi:MAG: hypothetical protein RL120_01080, partial [Gammaproteobacteria bacterium]
MNRSIYSGMVRLSILLAIAPITAFAQSPVGHIASEAVTPDGHYIGWREHIIDDPAIAGFPLNGSDGLVVGDIDRDGFDDVVSVHEFDASYDSASFTPGFEAPAD